jgi:HK97 family phage prohead protease
MQHMTKTATITEAATDRGEFSAIVSTYDIDRERDQVAPGAFRKTISDWLSTGRKLPLHWNHESSPESIIGHVNPADMEESKAGLTVQGKVDLETDRGREAWRLLKANSVGFSFGYLATKTHDRSDGIRVLDEIDLFEVSIVPHPANNRTRLLAMKSTGRDNIADEIAAILNAGFDGMKRKRDEERRQREEIEELAAKGAKAAKPIQIKTFEV